MDSIFEYTDYRDVLKDYYTKGKQEGRAVSYRIMGKKLKVDASLLVKVLRGDRHLSEESMQLAKSYLKLNPKESDFFEALFFYSQAQNEQEIEFYYSKMKEIAGVEAKRVTLKEYSFYHSWRNTALWALIHIHPRLSIEEYAKRLYPPSTPTEVKESLETLEALEMVVRNEDDSLEVKERHLMTGTPVDKQVLREYYRQMIGLASDSLAGVAPDKRDISGITIALDQECLEDVREIIRDARKKIQMRVDEVKEAQTVMQMNFQLFPLSTASEEAGGLDD